MSADNRPVILATLGEVVWFQVRGQWRSRYKTEYRVALVENAENLIGGPCPLTGEPSLDVYYASTLFGKCRVFTDRRRAEAYLQALIDMFEHDLGFIEDEVLTLDFRDTTFPSGLRLAA